MTMTGAGLLWVGCFGFNAGSAVQSGLDTARALTMTQISAASGALTWMIIEALGFRIDQEGQLQGLDQSLHGESGYGLIFFESRL